MEQAITVRIHGRDYTLSTIQDAEYTKNLAGYCDWLMKNIAGSTGSSDYIRLSVLTMMQMAHNYHQMKDAVARPDPEVLGEIERLIKLVDGARRTADKKADEAKPEA